MNGCSRCAREHGESYWLYVVEYAADERARVIRIQDPAGKAKTYTFDHGWLAVAATTIETVPEGMGSVLEEGAVAGEDEAPQG